jgi:hypothetical protein
MKYIIDLLFYVNILMVSFAFGMINRSIAIAYTLISALLIIAIKMVPYKYIVSLGKWPRWSYFNDAVMLTSFAGLAITSSGAHISLAAGNLTVYMYFLLPMLLFSILFSVQGILNNRVRTESVSIPE